jgi:hypothetical protein
MITLSFASLSISGEKFQAYRNSAAFKELVPTRDKLAKFRSFTIEGLPN